MEVQNLYCCCCWCFFFAFPCLFSQATDYEKIITNKMDINSVGKRLRNNRYPTVEAFFNDLFLVYDNAIRYYEQGGLCKSVDVYQAAKVGSLGYFAPSSHLLNVSRRACRYCAAVLFCPLT